MRFAERLDMIEKGDASPDSFVSVCQKLEDRIFRMKAASLPALLVDIGSIPESIDHDSTSEKLFA